MFRSHLFLHLRQQFLLERLFAQKPTPADGFIHSPFFRATPRFHLTLQLPPPNRIVLRILVSPSNRSTRSQPGRCRGFLVPGQLLQR